MNQVDIASSLFQIKKKVAEATEQAWEIECQKLLMEFSRATAYGGGLEALLKELQAGTKTLADYQIMQDGSIRPVDPAPVVPEVVMGHEPEKDNTNKSKNRDKEVAGVT